jgi:hypothetical protein
MTTVSLGNPTVTGLAYPRNASIAATSFAPASARLRKPS